MPERIKITFEDSDSDHQSKKRSPTRQLKPQSTIDQNRKRTADQAFKSTPILQKHRHNGATRSSKIVDFTNVQQDELKNGHLALSTSDRRSLPPSHNVSGLKQRANELLNARQKLPIWGHTNEILDKVRANDVLLLVGETGSGKSTQVPQCLLPLCRRVTAHNGSKIGGRIAITQPRRVAAISLARRVAEEMGTPLGKASPASQVGYSVRFDSNTSPSTRVKFVTDGTLLQELVRDPWLKEYSVVVVDEVHERGVNVDLVLGFLKRLIDGRNDDDGRGGTPLKVVVMSATADMEKIQSFFEEGKVGVIPSLPSGQQKGTTTDVDARPTAGKTNDSTSSCKIASCYIKGRQFPVTIHYVPIPVTNVLDAAMERIVDIHRHAPLPGDILVFLPGQETIDALESMCIAYSQSLTAKSKEKGAPKLPKLLILPLFAALPTVAQQRVFDATPAFTRKVILATNIAETSVTVPGIRFVIDTGKRKARFFRPGLNLDTLLTKAVSRSSANQRAGRAGREAAGSCYRLYTEKTFYELEADTEPEMLRCDLSQLVLILKSHGVDNILSFPLLTPPPEKSFKRALLTLLRLKALARRDGQITKLGRQMSTLPLPANLARILLASQLPQYDCLEEIIDIVSGLSVENIWLPVHNTIGPQRSEDSVTDMARTNMGNTSQIVSDKAVDNDDNHNDSDGDEESRNPIAQARSTLYRREGDHLTLLAAIQAYAQENTDRKEWCRRHGTSHRAMNSAMDVRKQLRTLFFESKAYNSKHSKNTTTTNTTTTTTTTTTSTTNSTRKANQRKRRHQQSSSNKTLQDNQDDNNETDMMTATKNPVIDKHPTPNPFDTDKNTRILQTLLLGLADNVAFLNSQHPNPSSSTSTTKNESSIWTGPYTTLSSSMSSFTTSTPSKSIPTSTPTQAPTAGSTNPSAPGLKQGTSGGRKNLQIHPSSVLFSRGNVRPSFIMFSEFVVTGRAYARCVSAIEASWLNEEQGGDDDDDDHDHDG